MATKDEDNWDEYCKEHDAFYRIQGMGCRKCNQSKPKDFDKNLKAVLDKICPIQHKSKKKRTIK